MASLLIARSPAGQAGQHFKIHKRTVAGGRHPSQEIQLLDPRVSRRHFVIRVEGERHVITETKASNGIFVNDKKVAEHTLLDGDVICVGETVLLYHTAEMSDVDALQEYRRGDRQLREGGTMIDEAGSPGKR